MIRRFGLPPQEQVITRALSVVGLVGLVWTGILGGRMMFEHAAGVPTKTLQAEILDRAAGHDREAGEEHQHADTTKTAPPHTH